MFKTKATWTDTTPGVHSNPNVVWEGTSEADYMDAGADMKTKHDAAPEGTQTQKDDAVAARVKYLELAGGMSKQADMQCGGDELKLKSTGFTLNAGSWVKSVD